MTHYGGLAFSAGIRSMLIIGSAAGVVAMGMEKISFGTKKVAILALIGFCRATEHLFVKRLCYIKYELHRDS